MAAAVQCALHKAHHGAGNNASRLRQRTAQRQHRKSFPCRARSRTHGPKMSVREGARTATSQMVAESAPSLVARQNPSSCPRRAKRDLRVERIHSVRCVCASARTSFSGLRAGNPTCPHMRAYGVVHDNIKYLMCSACVPAPSTSFSWLRAGNPTCPHMSAHGFFHDNI